ncbi:MAG: bis(5'-nucleosyl)-tetraphosphatase (symmetrical) YqeK [Oscillospiraceae bacterium]|nr:bis(5'-nucleosyl)-tetraphosphatase (symmetrical) YqeK [Oscillospiraceae bacterium]
MSRYEEFDEYEKLVKDRLSKKRFTHSMNVAEACYHLAKRYGADEKRSYLAGLLHDIMKEENAETQKQYAADSGLSPDPAELAAKQLWHGIAGAYYVREKLNITDAEIIGAIRYHTVGRAEMTLIEKIVYLGDMISDDRNYKGIDKMREYCSKDIDLAMSIALIYQVQSVAGKCSLIPVSTFEAYNYYLKFNKERETL